TFVGKRGKRRSLVRVRWANPELHHSKDGSPMKYQSPYGSGSELWIPNFIIKAYRQHDSIPTLVVCEGEKKADALCLAGVPAVAIMGIHNWSNHSAMPHQFELLIKRLGVRQVAFMFDSDWGELSLKQDKPVDQRPKTFANALRKFRQYFYGFIAQGYDLQLFFAYGVDPVYKGIDDLLVRGLNDPQELVDDFARALNAKEPQGEHIHAHDITAASDYKLSEFWHLHSHPAFLEHHKEALAKLPVFRLGKLSYAYDEDSGAFELAQKVLPHEQYWLLEEFESRDGKVRRSVKFSYQGFVNFASSRQIFRQPLRENKYRLIQLDGKVVREIYPIDVREYMIDFTRELGHKDVLEMLLKGGKQYFGPDNLSNLNRKEPDFLEPEKDCQFLVFKNGYWKITAEGITQHSLSELPGHVWAQKLIDFQPKLLAPLADVAKENGHARIEFSDDFDQSDIASFYLATSNFHWRKFHELVEDEEGNSQYVNKRGNAQGQLTPEERQDLFDHLASKMLAAGYVLHEYLDRSRTKAIVCMDGQESEVGRSQGGTGKSLWAKQFTHVAPMLVLDGKKKNLEDDNHLFEEVDERTRIILFDDVRTHFSFEFLFAGITTALFVNPKGEKRFRVDPPKFIISTNHALDGEGNSFERRQFAISFSDYFNEHRTVADEFGRQLFYEWDEAQWNLFYNWLAVCIQAYLRHGLSISAPNTVLKRRKLRQEMGENFLEWASVVFDATTDVSGDWVGVFLNKRVEKQFLLEKFLEHDPTAKRYMNATKFKDRLKKYAEYAGLQFNPTTNGGRLKSNGREFFILASERFVADMVSPAIQSDGDLREWRTEHVELVISQHDQN
ncbi:MAG: DUF3854 domain-containing protein, partial [Lewinella sp.]|nr:DUF3854 domain-containing protein [Lewinella sp.]